jgi:signal transduction histidine kinase
MKLTTRFSLSHGGMVVLTLGVVYACLYGGGLYLFQKEARLRQQQQAAAFALATQEALLQREDVAVLNFMKQVTKNTTVAYAVYSNPGSGVRVVVPDTFAKDPVLFTVVEGAGSPMKRRLSDGSEVLEWTSELEAGGRLGRVSLGYSTQVVAREVHDQMKRWAGLGLLAGLAAVGVGWVVSWFLGRHLAGPLRKIGEGTHLVRAGKLDSLVEVRRSDEIGDLAREFNDMVLQLKELDAMKRDFTAGVTHDLGTPLHAIRSAINYLQAGDAGPLTEKQAEYLLMVSNHTAHLTAFINNLLTVARIEAAKVEPYFEPLDVMAHAKELTGLYEVQAREKGVQLRLRKPVPYISLMADVTMFRQVLMNLLSNAVKFTDQGEVEVTVTEEGGDFILEVKDSGIGIDPQHHRLIFDKFFRVRPPAGAPTRQGSGLGLSIVQGLVEVLGGKVTVESSLGEGSRFTVRLPKQPHPARLYQQEGKEAPHETL